jgi:dolichyl-diphosphooligosaccharide--protein glycosyltransferase
MEAERTLLRRVSPALILGGVFAVALFIRAFFAYELAIRDFLVSGGSDAFYFKWILDNIATTGRHLLRDEMLNFPVGMLNPRPPIYAWSVALVGMLVGNLQGSVPAGVGQTFMFSTAVWGALTIIPTYLLATEMFGRRTGYVAAFLLAVLPAHISRTPLSNGDHDALVLFFVVTAFYFLLKALRGLKERTWLVATPIHPGRPPRCLHREPEDRPPFHHGGDGAGRHRPDMEGMGVRGRHHHRLLPGPDCGPQGP